MQHHTADPQRRASGAGLWLSPLLSSPPSPFPQLALKATQSSLEWGRERQGMLCHQVAPLSWMGPSLAQVSFCLPSDPGGAHISSEA